MDTVKLLQVVGFKNSGKTTLILQLLEAARREGQAVSVIKHHGHGGEPAMAPPETDSMRFFDGGAASSLVCGDTVIQLHARNRNMELADLIALSLPAHPDLVLIEGFKMAPYAKIVLVRSQDDWVELGKLENIVLVIARDHVRLDLQKVIQQSNAAAIEEWFSRWLGGKRI